MAPRVHPFSYFNQGFDSKGNPKSGSVRQFERRDAAASFEILRPLVERGYGLGEALLNYPPDERDPKELLSVDVSGVAPEDLILVTTRPPKEDARQGVRKRVPQGYTNLEQYIFQTLDVYLEDCGRDIVSLSSACAAELEEKWESFATMEFKQRDPGALVRHRAYHARRWHQSKNRNDTLVFLIHTKHLWKGGPGLMVAFGMTGDTTLAWAYQLGHRRAQLLEEPRFLMARMTCDGAPQRHTSSRWAEDLPVEIILDLKGPKAALDALLPNFVLPAPPPLVGPVVR